MTFVVDEREQGGLDLNGDGDAFDQIFAYMDTATGEQVVTDLAIVRSQAEGSIVFDGRTAGFLVDESAQGGTDLNGDGDASDYVLHVVDLRSTGGAPFCLGDGTAGAACPCAPGTMDGGCDNAQATGGVRLHAEGLTSDGQGGGSVTLVGSGYPPAGRPIALVLRGPEPSLPAVPFGDGLRCVADAGSVVMAPAFSFGTSVHSIVHQAGAGSWYYQLLYRNQPGAFCDAQLAFNTSNGYRIVW